MAHPNSPVSLAEKLATLDECWSPRIVAEANGWHFKLVKVLGEFVWHTHPDVDEVFWVISGILEVRLEERRAVRLSPGDLFVVPRGMSHQPYAEEECHIALLEPAGVPNTGDTGGPRTAADVWA
jgi:mannose-6-phosphate isomerase-like protein (cupin superfamily)